MLREKCTTGSVYMHLKLYDFITSIEIIKYDKNMSTYNTGSGTVSGLMRLLAVKDLRRASNVATNATEALDLLSFGKENNGPVQNLPLMKKISKRFETQPYTDPC
jgi:hypothetical protein